MLVADKQQTLEEYLVALNARVDEVAVEYLALRAECDAAQAEAAKYKALWEGVPWDDIAAAIAHAEGSARGAWLDELKQWLAANAPQPQGEEA